MRFVKTVENLFGLPPGFTRVEYLESSGTQYIDTGFKPNPTTTRFELTYSTTRSTSTFPFGSRVNSSFPSTASCTSYISDTSIRADWAGSNSVAFTTTSGKINNLICENNKMTLNGSDYQGSVEKSSSYLDYNFLLFNMWDGSSGVRATGFDGKFYKAKLWDNGTLVRDFVPCIDPLGVACMYDLVGKKPYYNQGTGTFTAGRQVIPVDYLEGTGTQYIDTGLDYFADFEVGIQLRTNVSNKALGNGAFYCMQRYNASNPYWYFTTGSGTSNSYASSTRITEHHVMKWKDNKIYSDDVLLTEFTKDSNTQNRMCLYATGSSNKYPNVIYFCKLWNPADGTLVRDFIPCKDENDNGFLFDKVSGTCYLNSGTGDFVVGENKYKTKLRLVKDSKLPAGYTQVEYLESTGTQWIDTGINPDNANTKQVDIETNFAILTPGSDQYIGIFGAAVPRFGFYTRYNNMCFGYYQASDNLYEIEYGKKYNLRFNVTKGSQNAKLNGVTVWSETRSGILQSTYTIGLFCRNYSTPQWINNARIYNLKIAIDGALVRNFIPALDPTGTPCMYDMVTKTPFYNQGTGTFSYGKTISMVRFVQDIVPREYAAVNYIASSNGYQYINTGYTGNSATRVIIGASSSLESSNIPLFGARDTNGYYNSFSIWQNVGANGMRFDYTDTTANVVYSHTWLTTGVNIIEKNGRYNYVNGVLVNSNAEKTFSCNNPFYLMSINTSGISMNGFVGSVSFCKIYENNTLVRNFIPVVRRIDKVAGMWDTITKQFYGNSGTGNFNYG